MRIWVKWKWWALLTSSGLGSCGLLRLASFTAAGNRWPASVSSAYKRTGLADYWSPDGRVLKQGVLMKIHERSDYRTLVIMDLSNRIYQQTGQLPTEFTYSQLNQLADASFGPADTWNGPLATDGLSSDQLKSMQNFLKLIGATSSLMGSPQGKALGVGAASLSIVVDEMRDRVLGRQSSLELVQGRFHLGDIAAEQSYFEHSIVSDFIENTGKLPEGPRLFNALLIETGLHRGDSDERVREIVPTLSILDDLNQVIDESRTMRADVNSSMGLANEKLDHIEKGWNDYLQALKIERMNAEDKALDNDAKLAAERKFQSKLAAGQVWIGTAGQLIGLKDPKLAMRFQGVAQAGLTVASALHRLHAGFDAAGSLNGSLASLAKFEKLKAVGDILGSVVGVVALFSGGPSADALILHGITAIRQDLAETRLEMHQRFDELDVKLNSVFGVMAESFNQLLLSAQAATGHMEVIESQIEQLRQELVSLEYLALSSMESLSDNAFREKVAQCAGSSLDYSGAHLSNRQLVSCLSSFETHATQAAASTVYSTPADQAPSIEDLENRSDHYWRYLGNAARLRGNLAVMPGEILSNPTQWSLGAEAFIETLATRRDFSKNIESAPLTRMTKTGERLRQFVNSLTETGLGADPAAGEKSCQVDRDINSELEPGYQGANCLFRSLIQDYKAAATRVKQSLINEQQLFRTERSLQAVTDLYSKSPGLTGYHPFANLSRDIPICFNRRILDFDVQRRNEEVPRKKGEAQNWMATYVREEICNSRVFDAERLNEWIASENLPSQEGINYERGQNLRPPLLLSTPRASLPVSLDAFNDEIVRSIPDNLITDLHYGRAKLDACIFGAGWHYRSISSMSSQGDRDHLDEAKLRGKFHRWHYFHGKLNVRVKVSITPDGQPPLEFLISGTSKQPLYFMTVTDNLLKTGATRLTPYAGCTEGQPVITPESDVIRLWDNSDMPTALASWGRDAFSIETSRLTDANQIMASNVIEGEKLLPIVNRNGVDLNEHYLRRIDIPSSAWHDSVKDLDEAARLLRIYVSIGFSHTLKSDEWHSLFFGNQRLMDAALVKTALMNSLDGSNPKIESRLDAGIGRVEGLLSKEFTNRRLRAASKQRVREPFALVDNTFDRLDILKRRIDETRPKQSLADAMKEARKRLEAFVDLH